jgi:hypothetical protein
MTVVALSISHDCIRKTLFGTECIADKVILTPLSEIFHNTLVDIPVESESFGWWNVKNLRFGNGLVSYIKFPQGYAVIDALSAANMHGSKAILLGYAGGNSEMVNIGDVLCPTSAHNGDFAYYSSLPLPFSPKVGSLAHSNTFYEQDDQFIEQMRRDNHSCVDMETFLFYMHADRLGIKAASALVISDLVDSRPFYMVDEADKESVRKSFHFFDTIIKEAYG